MEVGAQRGCFSGRCAAEICHDGLVASGHALVREPALKKAARRVSVEYYADLTPVAG